MIDCRFKPIEKWPSRPTREWMRKSSPFKAGWQQTLDLLERELNHLSAKDISIEGFFHPSQIRNDGWPKSSARPSLPGVILSFDTKRGRMVAPCDRYSDWEANPRAIALTLERLRSVERYGIVTEQQEQYTGWLRLPEASAVDEATECAMVLIRHASVGYVPSQVLNDQQLFKQVYAEAMRRTHPDTNSGRNSGDFNQVLTARDRLRQLKGWQ
ncbi:MAG: hypothetical protein ACREAB_01560 [Blastocatellia bacterium]